MADLTVGNFCVCNKNAGIRPGVRVRRYTCAMNLMRLHWMWRWYTCCVHQDQTWWLISLDVINFPSYYYTCHLHHAFIITCNTVELFIMMSATVPPKLAHLTTTTTSMMFGERHVDVTISIALRCRRWRHELGAFRRRAGRRRRRSSARRRRRVRRLEVETPPSECTSHVGLEMIEWLEMTE